MKAMLDPRMVAASIQPLASDREEASAVADRMLFSSQGVLMVPMDAILEY
jgi:hypothetical protein